MSSGPTLVYLLVGLAGNPGGRLSEEWARSRRLGTCPGEENSDSGFLGFRRERVSISDQSQDFLLRVWKGCWAWNPHPPAPPAPYTASQGGWSFPGKASFLSLVFCYCCHCLICSTVHLQCHVSFRCAASTVIQLCIHISILSQSLLPYGLIQSIEQSSWCSAVGPTAYLFCISSHAHLVLCWENITWYGDAIPLEKSCMFPYEIVQKTVWCKGKQGDQDGRGSEK